ncbi:MAG: formyltransferase family protein, partial [Clostridium sp.]
MLNIGVLISGGGTNLQAIIDGCENKIINGEIKVVISNKAEAYGLERAK